MGFISKHTTNFPQTTPPLKPQHRNIILRQLYHRIRKDLDCIHWCKRKTLRWGGLNLESSK